VADPQLANLHGSVDLDPLYRNLVQMVRAYLRDYAKLNILLQDEETDDKTILMCLQLTVADINAAPPSTSFSIKELVTRGYTLILLYGTLVMVLESLMILLTRNHLNWQESGQLIGLQDKTPMVAAHVKYFRDVYQYQRDKKKIADSIMSAMDPGDVGVHSEYFVIHGYLWA